MAAKPTVLFVDDDQSILEGIRLAHGRRHNLRLASSGEKGLTILQDDPGVAVVVSDISMPIMDGAAFLARARQIAPNAVRMLLTGTSDIESAARAVNDGRIFHFLTKPCPPEALQSALELALELHVDLLREQSLAAGTPSAAATPQKSANLEELAGLSPREEEVLRLIAKGLRIPDVASLMSVTPHTVCSHIKNIYRKRQLGSRAEAALEAQRLGLV
jgi:DNA-binding NarL/FixJ family response regulator